LLTAAAERFLDALRIGGSDALVDRQRLPQVRRAFAGIAVLDVAAADAFQGARFFLGSTEGTGDG
jgi:hypothetical protein